MSSFYRNFAKRNDFMNILKELQKAVQKRERVANPLEEVRYPFYFRHNNDRVLLFTEATNETNAVVTNPNLKYYQMPYEPDGDKLRVWYRFNDVSGTQAKDWSGFNNHATIVGTPTKQAGHITNMDCLSFDGIAQSYVRCPHHSFHTVLDNLTQGFGISVWVKPTRIDLHGGKPRVIACKIDDSFSTKNRGWSLWIANNGTLFFVVKYGNTTYIRRAINSIPIMNNWYHITAFFSVNPTPTITPLHVNSVEYSNEVVTFNDQEPYFPQSQTTNLDMIIGGTDEASAARFAGAISDFRYFRDYIYTHADAVVQYSNKYTISDIVHVALVGVATAAFEAVGQTPPDVGETPPPPPAPSTAGSFSSISFSPMSFNIEKSASLLGGGGGGAATTIPDQFYDDFTFNPVYSITTVNGVSPDSKWSLRNSPSGTGYRVETMDYTHSGDRQRRVMRLRANNASSYSPTLAINTDRFYDIYLKASLRVIAQTSTASTSNTARILFKYVDESNYYYVALRPNGAQLLKIVAGTPTTIATESNSSGTTLYPIGSMHEVIVETRADGMEIYVWVDGGLVISSIQSNYNPPDGVITALTRAGFNAQNSDIAVDHILMRPVLGDSFQGTTYTINTAGNKSLNAKWETITAGNGTGATIRTYDQSSQATGGRVLNLNSGTGASAQPLLLSTNSFRGLDAGLRMGTLTQHTAAEANRAEFIFKYVDGNNYYWLQLLTTGWKVKRKLSGVTETVASDTTPTFSDNPAYPFHLARVQLYNAGKEFRLFLGNGQTLVYEEHFSDTGFSTDDGGLSAALGRIGFRAPLCNAVFDNVWCRMV